MKVKAATRGSELARWQATAVLRELEGVAHAETVGGGGEAGELVIISTAGDRDLASSLAEIGGKGVFVKEVQAAVLAGEADVAVHSAKDLPAQTPEGLTIGAVLKRGDPRDALVGCGLADLPMGATVATGAPRRRAQLAALRPDLRFAELRGNIATRLAKAGNYDAVVVAAAALARLGFLKQAVSNADGEATGFGSEVETVELGDDADASRHRGSYKLEVEVEGVGIKVVDVLNAATFIPQVGQGTIAVECRNDDEAVKQMLTSIDHSPTRICLEAERGFLQALGGDCNLPAGAHATLSAKKSNDEAASQETTLAETTLTIAGFLASPEGNIIRDSASHSLNPAAPLDISASTTGQNLARSLLAQSQ